MLKRAVQFWPELMKQTKTKTMGSSHTLNISTFLFSHTQSMTVVCLLFLPIHAVYNTGGG